MLASGYFRLTVFGASATVVGTETWWGNWCLWLCVLVNAGHVVVLCICLYLTLGNLFSTVYRVRLLNACSPSRIVTLLSQATFSLRRHGVYDTSPSHRGRMRDEGWIRETMLKHKRISQLIFKCCCCYIFCLFLGQKLCRSPNPKSCREANK